MGWLGMCRYGHCKCPVDIAWTVEADHRCEPSQTCIHPQAKVVSSLEELQAVTAQHTGPLHIRADVTHSWWQSAFLTSPISIATVSAPCQPWSTAGRESGLSCQDGRLLLHLARVCGQRAIPVVVIEQVAGFPHHAHYEQVLSAWRQEGYAMICRGTVNLHDVLPSSRSRFLTVLAHVSVPEAPGLAQFVWPERCVSTIDQSHAIFDLPPQLFAASVLDADTLQVYLDPQFMPGKFRNHPRAGPAQHRLITGSQVATCFMAQYGFSHKLPLDLLAGKGLYGSVLLQGQTARFFAAPEIASMMGALSPVWCPHDRRLAHRILGNCISVPHAILGLVRACQALKLPELPECSQVLRVALGLRIHNLNSVLVPFQEGWVLCHKQDVPRVLTIMDSVPALSSPDPDTLASHDLFGRVTLRSPHQECTVWCPRPLVPSRTVQMLGYPSQVAASWMRDEVDAFAVSVDNLPVLSARGLQTSRVRVSSCDSFDWHGHLCPAAPFCGADHPCCGHSCMPLARSSQLAHPRSSSFLMCMASRSRMSLNCLHVVLPRPHTVTVISLAWICLLQPCLTSSSDLMRWDVLPGGSSLSNHMHQMTAGWVSPSAFWEALAGMSRC